MTCDHICDRYVLALYFRKSPAYKLPWALSDVNRRLFSLKMEADPSFETSEKFYEARQRHIPIKGVINCNSRKQLEYLLANTDQIRYTVQKIRLFS
jgi:hypothetical protein